MNLKPRHYLLTALLGLLAFSAFMPFKKKKPDPYLFSYYINDGASGLHLAWSEDGFKWTALNKGKGYIKPDIGDYLMQDPHLSQTPDGMFHLVWATGKNRRDLGYSRSENLKDWSAQRLIAVMEDDSLILNASAPELIYDPANLQFNRPSAPAQSTPPSRASQAFRPSITFSASCGLCSQAGWANLVWRRMNASSA